MKTNKIPLWKQMVKELKEASEKEERKGITTPGSRNYNETAIECFSRRIKGEKVTMVKIDGKWSVKVL